MKYIKHFEQASAYEAYKNGSDYVTPNVSYVVENNVVNYNPFTESKSGIIIAKYNATEENKLALGDTSNVKSLKVNGVKVEFGDTYYFNEVGEYDVEIELIDTTLINGVNMNGNMPMPKSMFWFLTGACLTSLILPEGIITIGMQAFCECKGLTGELVIPDSVTTIENNAFVACSGLTTLIIGSGVTTIERAAFAVCSSLTSITCNAPIAPYITTETFNDVKQNGILKVPAGSDYSSWMSTDNYYLGKYNWTVEYI